MHAVRGALHVCPYQVLIRAGLPVCLLAWSNRPPLAVILFMHYIFSQIHPENAKTVQQGSLSQLSILQMVDKADLEPLRCVCHSKASHAARVFSRFQAEVLAGFLRSQQNLLMRILEDSLSQGAFDV